MTKREFLIKWKVDKEFINYNISLDYVNIYHLILKHNYDADEYKFNFVKDDIDNYIELLNDYKNIDWNNSSSFNINISFLLGIITLPWRLIATKLIL